MNLCNSWEKIIHFEVKKNYFKMIKQRLLEDNEKGLEIYPNPSLFFKAFGFCDLEKTKVIIVGQDPYHTPGIADGLAFSSAKKNFIPPSLKNIFKELEEDLGIINEFGALDYWAHQGVLLLNTSLSVVKGIPSSHSNIGWELFTDSILSLLGKGSDRVFVLWGNHAKAKRNLFNTKKNLILESAHPSPLSASKGFFGCKHFSKINDFLATKGLSTIDWQLDSNS